MTVCRVALSSLVRARGREVLTDVGVDEAVAKEGTVPARLRVLDVTMGTGTTLLMMLPALSACELTGERVATEGSLDDTDCFPSR